MTINRSEIEQILKVRDDGTLYHRESQSLEFKESFNFAGLAEYFRDFAAFANNKGGYLIFGIKDKPRRELIGLNNSAKNQLEKLDPEKITGYLLEDFTGNIVWDFDLIEINGLHYGVFYVHEATVKPIICKKDEINVIKNGEIYFRYGGRTQKIQYAELEAIINHRIERHNNHWMDLITKIGKAGPQNAAVLDLDKGTIEKNNSQVLVVDESLVESINWIKEGCFDEKEGARTLKLVGQVQPIDTVEVVKRERINRLKEYPLSAKELADKIKEKSDIQQKDVWRIIKENDIKTNLDYSIYNFRNKKQEEDYEQTGRVPAGTPSIYKISTIDYVIQIYNNEH